MVFICLFLFIYLYELKKIYGKKKPTSLEVWLSPHLSCFSPQPVFSVSILRPAVRHFVVFMCFASWLTRGLLCPGPFAVGDPGPLHVELPQTNSNASVTPGPAAPTLTSWLCPNSSPPTLLCLAYHLKHSCVSSGLKSYAYSASMQGCCGCSLHRSKLVFLLLL